MNFLAGNTVASNEVCNKSLILHHIIDVFSYCCHFCIISCFLSYIFNTLYVLHWRICGLVYIYNLIKERKLKEDMWGYRGSVPVG